MLVSAYSSHTVDCSRVAMHLVEHLIVVLLETIEFEHVLSVGIKLDF